MQQFADEHTATPTHAHVHYIAAIGSLMTYMHAKYSFKRGITFMRKFKLIEVAYLYY
jgi:hypothetical protein